MFIAKVIGSLVATQKVDAMVGNKLLLVEALKLEEDETGQGTGTILAGTGRSMVVVDTVGAGENQLVLVVQGSSARMTPETKQLPIDAAIIGIVDTITLGRKNITL